MISQIKKIFENFNRYVTDENQMSELSPTGIHMYTTFHFTQDSALD